jgi:hypothetical protein
MYHFYFWRLLSVFTLLPLIAFAQNEVQRERSSLRGIAEMGFTVNLETNVSLNKKGELEVTSLHDAVHQTLTDAAIDIVPDEQVRSSDQIPFLYMHINSMDAGQGLVPFSISLRFYQPVKLMLNRDQQTSASTWQTGTVGIVSYDQMHVIQEAAVNLVREFIDEFKSVNEE